MCCCVSICDRVVAGGLGEAVASALALETGVTLRKLAVTGVPRSGQSEELLAMFGIDAASICAAVTALLH